MTTLYRPVLIESAEQAEALPIGTMAARENRFYSVKLGDDLWTDGMSAPQCNADMVGWTALVPIEAEEETTGALVNRVGEIAWQTQTRRVTPWEEA